MILSKRIQGYKNTTFLEKATRNKIVTYLRKKNFTHADCRLFFCLIEKYAIPQYLDVEQGSLLSNPRLRGEGLTDEKQRFERIEDAFRVLADQPRTIYNFLSWKMDKDIPFDLFKEVADACKQFVESRDVDNRKDPYKDERLDGFLIYVVRLWMAFGQEPTHTTGSILHKVCIGLLSNVYDEDITDISKRLPRAIQQAKEKGAVDLSDKEKLLKLWGKGVDFVFE